LEYASKILFKAPDKKVLIQNVLTDLENGDIIEGDVGQIEVRMQGFDQLIADWNKTMELADKLANSYEIVAGETMPAGTPFQLGALLNVNANKLFEFIRQKLGIVYECILEEWIVPQIMKELKSTDVLRITGDSDYLDRYYQILVDAWYVTNLAAIGPHTKEMADGIKKIKLDEIRTKGADLVKLEKGLWDGVKPRINITITGERIAMQSDLATLAQFIGLESDPVRRSALIEMAMKKKGIDTTNLPKTEVPKKVAPPAPRQLNQPAGAGAVQ
jgi:hypothetical protein